MGSFNTALNGTAAGIGLLGQVFGMGGAPAKAGYNPSVMQSIWSAQDKNIQAGVDQANSQADLALKEALDAAEQIAYRGKQFRESQANNYSTSGILLEGSPMTVLNDTKRQVDKEISAQANRGAALAGALRYQGYSQANNARAALLGQQIQYSVSQANDSISSVMSRPNIAQGILGLANALTPNSSVNNAAKQQVQANAAGTVQPQEPSLANPFGGNLTGDYIYDVTGDLFGVR